MTPVTYRPRDLLGSNSEGCYLWLSVAGFPDQTVGPAAHNDLLCSHLALAEVQGGEQEGAGVLCLPSLERGRDHWADRDQACRKRVNPGSTKIMLASRGGQPVARSTLRKALLAVRQVSGVMFEVDAYIVDQRTTTSR